MGPALISLHSAWNSQSNLWRCLTLSSIVHLASGGLFLPETPNSLVERGYLSEAKNVLQKVRGTKDVDVEFDTIVLANEALKGMENPWRAIFRRRNRPQLILAIAMPFFQCVPDLQCLSS